MTPEDLYDKCWAILVEQAGAYNNSQDRRHFVEVCLENHGKEDLEFRFCGSLGFGGKFRRYLGLLYVDCYPEDATKERLETVKRVNLLLAQLV